MAKIPERGVDYEVSYNGTVFDYDPEPILLRIRNLSPRRKALFDQWYVGNIKGTHKIRELTWEQATQIGKALTAYESDEALGEVGDTSHRASTSMMTATAESMANLGPGLRVMVLDLFANYGIQYDETALICTVGMVDAMNYLIDHIPEGWRIDDDLFDGAVDITDQSRDWETLVEEQKAVNAAADNAVAVAEALAKAPLGVDPHQRAPEGYAADVPEGNTDEIKAWVEEPRRNTSLDARVALEMVRERSHQAEIAEIRRRGAKQRKSLFTAMRKLRPSDWVPPYLRGVAADAETPAMPGATDVTKLTEGQCIHITVRHDGVVGYWVEG